jgi:hypothetical protein
VRDGLGLRRPARTVRASYSSDNPIEAPRMKTHRLWSPMPNKNSTPPTQPHIVAVVPRGQGITLNETCLDGVARWNGCLILSGMCCGICMKLVSRSGR